MSIVQRQDPYSLPLEWGCESATLSTTQHASNSSKINKESCLLQVRISSNDATESIQI